MRICHRQYFSFYSPKSNIPKIYSPLYMPVVTFDYNEFLDLLGYQIPKDKLIEKP